jgi:hypothetical protein
MFVTQAQPEQPQHAIPVLVGEKLRLPGAAEITLVSGDAEHVAIEPDGVTFDAPGPYHVRATAALRELSLRVISIDPAVVERIFVDDQKLSRTQSVEAQRLAVLRSLAAHEPQFDGSIESLSGLNLTHHGADPTPHRRAVRNR